MTMYHALASRTEAQFCEPASEMNLPGRVPGPYRFQGRPFAFTAVQTGERRRVAPFEKKAATITTHHGLARKQKRRNKVNATKTKAEKREPISENPRDKENVPVETTVKTDWAKMELHSSAVLPSAEEVPAVPADSGVSEYSSSFSKGAGDTVQPVPSRASIRLSGVRNPSTVSPLLQSGNVFAGCSEYSRQFEWKPAGFMKTTEKHNGSPNVGGEGLQH